MKYIKKKTIKTDGILKIITVFGIRKKKRKRLKIKPLKYCMVVSFCRLLPQKQMRHAEKKEMQSLHMVSLFSNVHQD